MDSKHTPGPWEAQTHIANEAINRVRPVFDRRNMGKLPACEGGGFYIRNRADAHLIAAAPDMLEALRFIAANSGDPVMEASASAAIAKAEAQ